MRRAAFAPPPWSVGLILGAFFLALTPGIRFGSIDGEMVYWATVAMAERQSAAVRIPPLPHIPWLIERGFLQAGSDGRWFIRYNLGQPLAALPFYILGNILGGPVVGQWFVNLLPAVASAIAGAILYHWAARIYGPGVALGITALWALATPAPVYARLFFAEALITLCLLVGLRAAASSRPLSVILGGFAIGWALLTREGAAAAVPAALLVLVLARRTWPQRFAALARWAVGSGSLCRSCFGITSSASAIPFGTDTPARASRPLRWKA